MSPGLPNPTDAGLWQLMQGLRYGSHHAQSPETSWWIGNKNCQILRRTHTKLYYMQLSYKNWLDGVKCHSSYSAELSPTGSEAWEIILHNWQVELSTLTVKIRNQPIQKRSCFWYRKLCAFNLLTWRLNVLLRYSISSDICVAEILWASSVPESSWCWQHRFNYHITAWLFHIRQDMLCD